MRFGDSTRPGQARTRCRSLLRSRPAQATRPGAVFLAVAASLLATGCDPVLEVAGSFLPAWMPCLVVGAILAALAHLALVRTGLDPHVGPRPLVYGAIAAIGAMTTWLVLFPS
ncbi:MAG: YtcA family lipoprotein [Alphaproteobacteria bacterium]